MIVDVPEILNDTMRANVREELTVMAADIRRLVFSLENELAEVRCSHDDAVRRGTFMIVPYQLEAERLNAVIEAHHETRMRVSELADMTYQDSVYVLTRSIRQLQLRVAPWLMLNPARLPWHIRSRLHDAERLLF